jgi:hypothetical protein
VSARPALAALRIADPPERWHALGFALTGRRVLFDSLHIELQAPGHGIVGWRLSGVDARPTVDGLATADGLATVDGLPTVAGLPTIDGLVTETGCPAPRPEPARPPHPNGALGIDHLVVMTPDFQRTGAALAAAGMPLRRIREVPGGVRQGFRRLGPVILELVEAPDGDGPARFWGLVVTVSDLDALVRRLGDRLGAVKDAVQPGRRIVTLRASAGLGEAVAFMSPEAV